LSNASASFDDDIGNSPRRFLNPRSGETFIRVFQGQYYVTNDPTEVLSTVLGSCIAVCVRDPQTGYGGMNHFLLPEAASSRPQGFSLRYGVYSVERLVNDILGHGGERHRLEIKVFGGANVLRGMAKIGSRNADFVERYLASEGLPIAAMHLRGDIARRIRYYPKTGRVMLSRISRDAIDIGKQEIKLLDQNLLGLQAGETEIFKRS
jgi:chemotaxis protein CheD